MREVITKKITCIMSVFLIIVLAFSTVNAATDAAITQVELPSRISEVPIKLSYFYSPISNISNDINNLSDSEFYKDLEMKTNVKVTFIQIPVESSVDRYMLMLAANDLSDIIEFPAMKYNEVINRYIDYGAVLKLDSLLEKNAPNLNKIFQINNDLRRQLTLDNGAIYQLPGLNQTENSLEYQPLIRGDILKKLGLAMPETINDWEVILKKIKEQTLSKSPLCFDMSTLDKSNSFIGAFGINRDFYLKSGRVAFGPIEKPYKDMLTTLSGWYKNGLLDKEFILLKNTQVKSRVNKGDVGAFIGTQDDLKSSLEALKALDSSYELVSVQNPGLNKAEKRNISLKTENVNLATSIVISKSNKYPVETMKWLDYACSESLKYINKSQVQTYEIKLGASNLQDKYNKLMPQITLTQKENEEANKIMKDINIYCMEIFAKVVLGAEPLDNFDKHVERVRKLGIDRVIQIKQAALYRYDNRLTSDQIETIVNGSLLKMDTNPIIINESPLVPVRFVVEALGGKIDWDESDRSASFIKNNKKITFRIGSTDVSIDNEIKTLDTDILLLNERTYVPMEILSQILGVKFDWDEISRRITLNN